MSAFDHQEKKKEECEFVHSLYASNGNLHMRRRGYKKTKLARQGHYSESGEQTLS